MTSITSSMMMQTRVQFWWHVSNGHAHERSRGTYLEAADERVVDLLAEKLGSVVFDTRPSPHVLVLIAVSRVLKNGSSHGPHDHAEDEPTDGEHGVVDSDLLGPLVATAAVSDKDNEAEQERKAGTAEDDLLRPRRGVVSPWRETVHRRQGSGGVEDGERGRDHGHDDQAAAEADASERKLGHADASLDFLRGC
jgi:hypothetical protein